MSTKIKSPTHGLMTRLMQPLRLQLQTMPKRALTEMATPATASTLLRNIAASGSLPAIDGCTQTRRMFSSSTCLRKDHKDMDTPKICRILSNRGWFLVAMCSSPLPVLRAAVRSTSTIIQLTLAQCGEELSEVRTFRAPDAFTLSESEREQGSLVLMGLPRGLAVVSAAFQVTIPSRILIPRESLGTTQ